MNMDRKGGTKLEVSSERSFRMTPKLFTATKNYDMLAFNLTSSLINL